MTRREIGQWTARLDSAGLQAICHVAHHVFLAWRELGHQPDAAIAAQEASMEIELTRRHGTALVARPVIAARGACMSFEWTGAVLARARQLWDEGVSTARIAEQLGTSKNALVGKVNREGWPARKSPIVRTGEPRHYPAKRAARSTLPPLASVSVRTPAIARVPREPGVPAAPTARVGGGQRAAIARALRCDVPAPRREVGGIGCQFITHFNTRRPSLSTFCEAPRADEHISYCAEHRKIVFTRAPGRDPSGMWIATGT